MLRLTAALLLAACEVYAQDASSGVEKAKPAESASFYQLTFVVRELDGSRVLNTRTYHTSASTRRITSSLRAGEKVPFASNEGTSTIWQQIDVGVAIDYHDLEVVGDRLSLRVVATVDSLAGHDERPDDKSVRQPVIRNNRWDAVVLVPLRKPTVIFSSDDPFSGQKMQLQLTVEPTPQ